MTEPYPETDCPLHPSRMWEWDGYCYICPSCVLGYPKEEDDPFGPGFDEANQSRWKNDGRMDP